MSRGAFARWLSLSRWALGTWAVGSPTEALFRRGRSRRRAVDALPRALDGRENRVDAIRIHHELLEPLHCDAREVLARVAIEVLGEAVGFRQEVAALREEAIGRDGGTEVHGNLQRRLVERFLNVRAEHIGEESPRVVLVPRPG